MTERLLLFTFNKFLHSKVIDLIYLCVCWLCLLVDEDIYSLESFAKL